MPADSYVRLFDKLNGLQANIKRMQAEEKELRLQLMASMFPNAGAGTHQKTLDDGRLVKGVVKISRSVDAVVAAAIYPELARWEVNGNDLFKWDPTLIVKAYQKLGPQPKAVVDRAVTIKHAMPTLEVC